MKKIALFICMFGAISCSKDEPIPASPDTRNYLSVDSISLPTSFKGHEIYFSAYNDNSILSGTLTTVSNEISPKIEKSNYTKAILYYPGTILQYPDIVINLKEQYPIYSSEANEITCKNFNLKERFSILRLISDDGEISNISAQIPVVTYNIFTNNYHIGVQKVDISVNDNFLLLPELHKYNLNISVTIVGKGNITYSLPEMNYIPGNDITLKLNKPITPENITYRPIDINSLTILGWKQADKYNIHL